MTETFLVQMLDKDDRLIDFHRFNYKRVSTVKSRILDAASDKHTGMMSLYRTMWMRLGVVKCRVFSVEDGKYSTSPVMGFDIDWG